MRLRAPRITSSGERLALRVQRHEPLRDRLLAAIQVLLARSSSSRLFSLICAWTWSSLMFARLSRSFARPRLVVELARSRRAPAAPPPSSPRWDPGSRTRDCDEEGRKNPEDHVDRMSASGANDNPRIADGTGAPGGAGASRVGQVSKVFGQVQPGTDRRRPRRQGRTDATKRLLLAVFPAFPGRVRAVLGQAHAPRRRAFGIAVAASCFLVLPAVGGAEPSRSAAHDERLKAENAALASQERSAVLEPLRARLAARPRAGEARASSSVRPPTLRREQVVARGRAEGGASGARVSQQRLASRVRLLFDHGDTSTLEIIFGARSLDDALVELDSLERVTSINNEVLAQLQRRQGADQPHVARARERAPARLAAALQAAGGDDARARRDAGRPRGVHRRACGSSGS